MSKAANKTMIGAFVLGAAALAILAVAVFGSGRFFKSSNFYVIYFDSSVKGLSPGAPVLFRGVQVGAVKDISLEFETAELILHIPVIIELYPEKAKSLGPTPQFKNQLLQPMIDKGLRAQLVIQSIITGQLAVALDFFPEKPAVFLSKGGSYPEIPSIPSSAEELQKTISEIPVKEILLRMDKALEGISKLVNSEDAEASMKSLQKMLADATVVMHNLNARIGPLVENLEDTSGEIRAAAANINSAMSGEQGLVRSTKRTLDNADQMIDSVRRIADDNSEVGLELSSAVEEMKRSMRSLRRLSDYLEQHPESLIRGKK
jgi:paraquat-inducible protein B